jgi:hypothetical protein
MTQDRRTTIIGLVSAALAFLAFAPELFPHWAVKLGQFAMAGGFAALGIAASDSKKPNG